MSRVAKCIPARRRQSAALHRRFFADVASVFWRAAPCRRRLLLTTVAACSFCATAFAGELDHTPLGGAAFEPLAPLLSGEGPAPVALMLFLALATFVSEDLTCIGAGMLAAHSTIGFWPAALACYVGICVGDVLLFLLGRHVGAPALRRAPLRWLLKEADLARARAWLNARGPAVILSSRFLPGTRFTTYVGAGMLHMPFRKFLAYFALSGLVWTPALVGAAYWLGERAQAAFEVYRAGAPLVLLGTVLLLLLVCKVLLPMCSFRGRRLLLSRWRRLTCWEFWPMGVVYPPLVLYILGLGLKHRGLTLFTAANPAMPAGGFVGESKTDILRGLAGAGEAVARFAPLLAGLTGAEGAVAVREFLRREGVAFPAVLKPDAGERGAGVAVVRSEDDVLQYFNTPRPATLVQEYISGREFGVFYYRHPDEPQGRILAITDKRFPSVTGDGRHTLEHLILADPRAVCMARFLLARHADALYRVPAAGEDVPLVELGTHSRGALFLDGARWITPELEAAIDRISRTYAGFYFGRYDLRVPDEADLAAGRNLKVLELNGVTSEATSIYDPKHGLGHAYGMLMRQWRLAFEIGAANRARGVRPMSVRDFVALVRGQ